MEHLYSGISIFLSLVGFAFFLDLTMGGGEGIANIIKSFKGKK